MLIIPALGKWRHVDPLGRPDRQPRLLGRFQASERPCLATRTAKEKGGQCLREHPRLFPDLHIHAFIPVHTQMTMTFL